MLIQYLCRYATKAGKARAREHDRAAQERELLIKAYRAQHGGCELTPEEEQELGDVDLSQLTRTPSSYTPSSATEGSSDNFRNTEEYRLSYAERQKYTEKMVKVYKSIVTKGDPTISYRVENMVGKGYELKIPFCPLLHFSSWFLFLLKRLSF